MVSAFKNRTKYDKIKKLQHSDHYPAAAYRSRTPRRPEQETAAAGTGNGEKDHGIYNGYF